MELESTRLNGGDAFEIAATPGDETREALVLFGNGGGKEINIESKSMESLDGGAGIGAEVVESGLENSECFDKLESN